jgi:hypothetical protein
MILRQIERSVRSIERQARDNIANERKKGTMMLRVINLNLKGATNMELTYRQNGDYLVPNLTLEEQPSETPGKYARMRRRFLRGIARASTARFCCRQADDAPDGDRPAGPGSGRRDAGADGRRGGRERATEGDRPDGVGAPDDSLKAAAEEAVLRKLIYN